MAEVQPSGVNSEGGGSLPTLSTGGPPTSGTYTSGKIFTDVNGAAWYCTVGGTPGTWTFFGFGFVPGILTRDSTSGTDYGAIINAYMATLPAYTNTAKLPPGTIYVSTEVVPPAGVTLIGSGWSQHPNAGPVGSQLKANTPGMARVASCSNANTGFKNLIVDGLAVGDPNIATAAFGVFADRCILEGFTAEGGSSKSFDSNGSATNLTMLDFYIESEGTASATMTVSGSDWICANGRIQVPVTFGNGGNLWANVHFGAPSTGTAAFTENGGNTFVGCYFDSMPIVATVLIDRSAATRSSTYSGCYVYQATTGLSATSTVFKETSTAGAGVNVTGMHVHGIDAVTFGYFIKGAIASTSLENVTTDNCFQTGFADASPPLGYFAGCHSLGVLAALGGAVLGSNQTKPVTLAGQSAVQVSHTGDTNEAILATIAIPAKLVGANGRIAVELHISNTNSANNKTLRVRYGATGSGVGGTTLASTVVTTSAQSAWKTAIANRNATNVQVASQTNMVVGTSGAALVTAAIDTTAATEINITGQLALGTETVAIESYQVLVYPL